MWRGAARSISPEYRVAAAGAVDFSIVCYWVLSTRPRLLAATSNPRKKKKEKKERKKGNFYPYARSIFAQRVHAPKHEEKTRKIRQSFRVPRHNANFHSSRSLTFGYLKWCVSFLASFLSFSLSLSSFFLNPLWSYFLVSRFRVCEIARVRISCCNSPEVNLLFQHATYEICESRSWVTSIEVSQRLFLPTDVRLS